MGGPNQLESSEHPYGADLTGPCASTSLVNYAPPVGYNSNMGYDDAFHTATDLAEHQENEGHGRRGTHLTPGVTQRNQAVPDPPTRLEYYASVAPEVPDDCHRGRRPHPYHAARPTPGKPGSLHTGISATKDLKDLASQYLHSPGSQVETLRMRRSRSGGFKVLILLDIDDTI